MAPTPESTSTPVPSALPSWRARALAVTAIVIAGLCGALIGYAFADNQCVSNCTNWKGIGLVVGALVGAVGVAIVAVLALRAMDEWQHNVDIERAALDRKLPDQDLARGTDPDPSDPDPSDPDPTDPE